MTNKVIYVAPRAKKQRRKPVRIDAEPGPAALLANVIGQAAADYVCGNAAASEGARRYFCSRWYQEHVTALGLPEDMLPAAIRERAIIMEL